MTPLRLVAWALSPVAGLVGFVAGLAVSVAAGLVMLVRRLLGRRGDHAV